MKATGIVRRIDELGRIVIPKEIRRTLRVRETDPMEIYTTGDGDIILRKYSPICELSKSAKEYAESLARTTGLNVCIADKDQIIAAAGTDKKELISQPVSRELERAIEDRKSILAMKSEEDFINIIDSHNDNYNAQAISPIICEGDVLGAVIMLSKDSSYRFSLAEQQLTATAADFLGKQMES